MAAQPDASDANPPRSTALNNALLEAARAGDEGGVEQAIRDGASPNASRDSRSAVWLAAFGGYTGVVRLLAQLGANVETQGKNGATPALHRGAPGP